MPVRQFLLPYLMIVINFAALFASAPKIKSIRFSGNTAFQAEQLEKVMILQPAGIFSKGRYYTKILNEDLIGIERFYHQNGYLAARITGQDTTHVDSDALILHIEIKEGPLTLIDSIRFEGNHHFSENHLKTNVSLHKNTPLRKKKIEETNVRLLQFYGNKGYLNARINPVVDINPESHRAVVRFQIREDTLFYLGKIRISGLQKTKPAVITREISIKQGDLIRYGDLVAIQKKCYLTGLFKEVFAEPDTMPNDAGLSDIHITVKEIQFGELNASLGYGSVEKARTRVELSYLNLGGMARKTGISANLSFVGRGFELSYSDPWLFQKPVRFDCNLQSLYQEEPGYHLLKYAGNASAGFSITERLKTIFRLRQDYVTLSDITISPIPEDLKSNIRSIKWTLNWDTRDNLFDARYGTFWELSHEWGRVFTSGSDRFFRARLTGKHLVDYKNWTFGSAFELGYMTTPGGLSRVPLQERFYLGGPNSVRGFEYRKLGPLDQNRTPTGGMISCTLHLFECRFPVHQWIGGAIFTDAGALWTDTAHINSTDLRFTSGLGVRIKTILGVGRLDYAWNLFPKAGEPPGAFAIGFGQIF